LYFSCLGILGIEHRAAKYYPTLTTLDSTPVARWTVSLETRSIMTPMQ
jgi:hypothetical protein